MNIDEGAEAALWDVTLRHVIGQLWAFVAQDHASRTGRRPTELVQVMSEGFVAALSERTFSAEITEEVRRRIALVGEDAMRMAVIAEKYAGENYPPANPKDRH